MTLLEALVAAVIVFGTLTTAIETFQDALRRSAAAAVETEAVLLAQSLLERAGRDLPWQDRHHAAMEDGGLDWAIQTDVVTRSGSNELVRVESNVHLARGNIVADKRLVSLRTRFPRSK